MKYSVLFAAIFWLAQLGLASAPIELNPLWSNVPLPAELKGKPVWCVEPLPAQRIAIGGAGFVAVGLPEGEWTIHPTPANRTVRALVYAHDALLVAGETFCAVLDARGLTTLDGPRDEYVGAEAVPEGWLIAGRDGFWLVDAQTHHASHLPFAAPGMTPRITRIGEDVIVSIGRGDPHVWKNGDLRPDQRWPAARDTVLTWHEHGLVVTHKGVLDLTGELTPTEATNHALAHNLMIGVARGRDHWIGATFFKGIEAFDTASQRPRWSINPDRHVYFFDRQPGGFFVGTASGLAWLHDPERVRFLSSDDGFTFALSGTDNGQLDASTSKGLIPLEPAARDETATRRASVMAAERGQIVVSYAKSGDNLLVQFHESLVFLPGGAPIVPLNRPGTVHRIGAEGGSFYVGSSLGILVYNARGEPTRQIGNGNVRLLQLNASRLGLLHDDGRITTLDGQELATFPRGSVQDVCMIGDQLIALEDNGPAPSRLLRLAGATWRPLDAPGLATFAAAHLAVGPQHVYVAGPRGVLRWPWPMADADAPAPTWDWTPARDAEVVALDDPNDDHVRVQPRLWTPPDQAATRFQLKTPGSEWQEVRNGHSFRLSVPAGSTDVTLRAERNGLVHTETVTIFRPWPWWARPWAWPLHLAILGAAIYGAIHWRTRRLAQRNRELEARVAARTEELRKANAAKEEFLASISHEIRNPLNGVVGLCAMLAEGTVGATERQWVRTLGGCAEQLSSMLDDILEFSRIERGQVQLNPVRFDLVSLLEESARVMDPSLQSCHLLLPTGPIWVESDAGKLRQIVCNLVSNALKYGVPSAATVDAQITPAGSGFISLRLALRNTGPTIPAAELPMLFESFRRGSNTSGTSGSGLGLAVCHRLALALGGTLTATSAEGATEFVLALSLLESSAPTTAAHAARPASRALAIEDEDYNRTILGHHLHHLGFQVDWAADGASAERLAREHAYDLILTDWRLPDMDGTELCPRLLAGQGVPPPPIIAITAYSSETRRAEAKRAGVAAFVTKPMTREKLETALRSLDTIPLQRPRTTPPPGLAPLPGGVNPHTLADDVEAQWKTVSTMAALHDPRTAAQAHGLLSLLRLAGDREAAEQVELFEQLARQNDESAVTHLTPIIGDEIARVVAHLRRTSAG